MGRHRSHATSDAEMVSVRGHRRPDSCRMLISTPARRSPYRTLRACYPRRCLRLPPSFAPHPYFLPSCVLSSPLVQVCISSYRYYIWLHWLVHVVEDSRDCLVTIERDADVSACHTWRNSPRISPERVRATAPIHRFEHYDEWNAFGNA